METELAQDTSIDFDQLLPASPLASDIVDSVELRHKIERLESSMMEMPQVALEVKHYFADGMYAREMFIPAGTLLTGAVHMFEHINVCTKGDISVLTEDGPKRIKAPATMIARPGTKRVGYAHEDTIWITFHATEAKTVEEAEARLVVANHDGLPYADIKKLLKGE